MSDEALTITFLDEDGKKVSSADLPLATKTSKPVEPSDLTDGMPPKVVTRNSTVTIVCHEADDTVVVFQAESGADTELLKVTGPPFGAGRGSASLDLQTHGGGGAEAYVVFELWNSTGGPCKAKVEFENVDTPYRAKVAGDTGPRPFQPVARWGVRVVRPGG